MNIPPTIPSKSERAGATVQTVIIIAFLSVFGLSLFSVAQETSGRGSSATPTPRFAVIDLGPNINPLYLNNLGSVVYASNNGSGTSYYFWKDGAPHLIGLDSVNGLNDQDTVAGTAGSSGDPLYANFSETWGIGGPSFVTPAYDSFFSYLGGLSGSSTEYVRDYADVVGIDNNGNIYATYEKVVVDYEEENPGAGLTNLIPYADEADYIPAIGNSTIGNDGVAGSLTAVYGYTPPSVNGVSGTNFDQLIQAWPCGVVSGVFGGTNGYYFNNTPYPTGSNVDVISANSAGEVIGYSDTAPVGVTIYGPVHPITNFPPFAGPWNIQHQVIGPVYGALGLPANGPELYDPTTTPPTTTSLDSLISTSSGMYSVYGNAINDSGAIAGTALETTPDFSDGLFEDLNQYALETTFNGTNSTITQSHGVLLVPLQLSVVNRDDPTQTWTNNTQQPMGTVVYGGIKAGDMVSWKIAGTDSWSGATFTWTVTDSSGYPVTDFNGATITGPSGVGINEWRIATWTAGGNDPLNQWLTWKPGTYNIKCVVSFAGGGTTPITFQQTVGTRANDVVAIAWINPAGVSLPTSGVDSDVLSTFPVSGTFAGPLARIFTSAYVLSLSTGATVRPVVAASLSSADDTYILNWLFHFAGNTAPPTSFADEPTLDTFVSTRTNYKLVNRLQVKWQQNAAKFVGTPLQIKNGVTVSIGTTTDPIWGLPAPGSAGPANGRIRITGNNTYNQMNDGSPDAIAVAAFNTLESPNIWSDIGSMFSEGPTTGSSYALAQQVYPTYFIYVRNSDGSFTQVDTKTQATNPSGNFSTTPYPGGLSIPSWIIP